MLIDAEKRHEAHPDTFHLPTREERDSLQVGDLAQLIFHPGERMWVEVLKVGAQGTMLEGADQYVGALRNDPIASSGRYGDWIGFTARHIIDVRRA